MEIRRNVRLEELYPRELIELDEELDVRLASGINALAEVSLNGLARGHSGLLAARLSQRNEEAKAEELDILSPKANTSIDEWLAGLRIRARLITQILLDRDDRVKRKRGE